ncbi:uncharacterized protein LOC144306121 isoform X4 [Canis aureus]
MCCKERTRRDYAEGELRWTMNARSTQSWWFAEGSRCLYWFNTEVLTSSHQNKKNKSDNLNKSPTELFQMFQTDEVLRCPDLQEDSTCCSARGVNCIVGSCSLKGGR